MTDQDVYQRGITMRDAAGNSLRIEETPERHELVISITNAGSGSSTVTTFRLTHVLWKAIHDVQYQLTIEDEESKDEENSDRSASADIPHE